LADRGCCALAVLFYGGGSARTTSRRLPLDLAKKFLAHCPLLKPQNTERELYRALLECDS